MFYSRVVLRALRLRLLTAASELLDKLNATVATFPSQLRYKNPAPNVVGKPGAAIFAQSLLRLEYLQLKYHIERLRADRKRRTSQGLFDTAREIVEAIAHIFVCDAHVTTHWFDWLVSVHSLARPLALDNRKWR